MISRCQVAEPYNRNAAVCGPFFFVVVFLWRLQSDLSTPEWTGQREGTFCFIPNPMECSNGGKNLKVPYYNYFKMISVKQPRLLIVSSPLFAVFSRNPQF